MLRAVLFDLDGTIVDFRLRVADSRRALISELGRLGLDTSKFADNDPTQIIFDKVALLLSGDGQQSAYAETMARLGAILDQFEAEAALAAELRPDALPTLRRLQDAPLELVLLTNSGREATDRLLQKFALAPFFRLVLSRNDVARLKPAPQGLEQALGLLRMAAHEAIYVGDSVLDVQAAKAAGLRIVSITSGVHPAEKLRAAAPEYVVDSLTEAADLILTLSRPRSSASVHG